MKKLKALIRIETLLFIRDFFGFFFTFLFPPMMLILYGSIYGNEPQAIFGELGTMDISVPAYSAMIIGVTGLMAFPLTLSGYKDAGIYKRFDATPAGKGLVIMAQVLVNAIMTLCGFALLMTCGILIYGIQIQGSLFMIIPALILSIAAIFSLGFLFTAAAPSARLCSLMCYVSYFVMLFLSGATLPKQMFPESVLNLSRFLPLTYVVDLLQGAFRGAPISELQVSLLVLSAVTIVCTSLGAWLYHRKSWG